VRDPDHDSLEQRVFILAPTGKDAALTTSVLEKAGVPCVSCPTVEDVCEGLTQGGGAVLLAEESVSEDRIGCLKEWLTRQPPWADLPLLVLARPGADSAAVSMAMETLGNVTVLERPMRVAALVSAVRSALRSRQRQYQTRDHLVERERSVQTQAFLASIVASSDDAIISKTLDGLILTWNAGAERIFGYSAEEAIGKPITLLIPRERHDEERGLLERLRRGERVHHFETVRVTKDGRLIDVSLTVSPILDSTGRVVGASKVARDITDRKLAELALRDVDRRKDEFLAILAHELRNPLAPIRNSLHILRLTSQNDPVGERVGDMMDRQVNHMVRLVDDLLEVSRITSGKIALRKERVDLAAILQNSMETSRPLIDAVDHHLTLAFPPEPLIVDGDPVRLAQVFANLLNNSAKYTDAGGEIGITARREGGWAVISVRDTGAGIPREMLPSVFELFTQIDRHADRAQGGLGIGLTLVKSLVEMHGGTVQANSAGLGQGSEFVVRLPLVSDKRPAELSGTPEISTSLLKPRRVLVVDDNRDAAESMGILLKLLGADVHVAYSGAEALEALPTYRPEVVLLDIGMPGMDGHEVARRIRQQPEFQKVTLIALTGWGQDEDRRRSQTAGFDYHLIKPADVDALQALLALVERNEEARPVKK
jgi:PAS domain S-box-containing protein